ncbi:MAG: CRISPR-associated endonuclease Cas2 [Muribaculaceae bacterium]|jgi:CRISPR-associated protein Cas2|nr:CRISPR-associated endonuclease Cas2 [Muribaculaceae bacterium]
MLALISYDVETSSADGKKRLRKVAKECVNYGQRVQNSVFECNINEVQLTILKDKIKSIINPTRDSVRIYKLGDNWIRRIESIGKETSFNTDGELII